MINLAPCPFCGRPPHEWRKLEVRNEKLILPHRWLRSEIGKRRHKAMDEEAP